jgi:hypothetical protein
MRTVSRLLAALLALALTAAGALVVIEVIAAAFGADPVLVPRDDWARDGRTTAWSATSVRVAFVVTAVAGLVLLAVALARRRADRVALASPAAIERADIRRRSLERSVERTAVGVDGIDHAAVQLGRRRLDIKAATNRRDATGLREAIEGAVRHDLERLQLEAVPAVRVATRARKQ